MHPAYLPVYDFWMSESNKENSVFLGIDPGKSGCAVVVDHGGSIVSVSPFDDNGCLEALGRVLASLGGRKDVRVAIEKVGAMPGNGTVSMFKFGQEYGMCLGMLYSSGFSVEKIPPRVWTKAYRGYEGEKSKDRVRAWAVERYGVDALLRNSRCKVPHSGICDALAIAEYVRGLAN